MSNGSGTESYLDPFCDSAMNSNESELRPEKLRLLYQVFFGVIASVLIILSVFGG